MSARITHFETAFTRIEIGGVTLLTDPVLDGAGGHHHFGFGFRSTKRSEATPRADIGRFDAVLVSHDQHADNLDESARALLADAPVISTRAAAKRVGGRVTGLAPFASTTIGDVKITATPARHGPPLSLPVVGEVVGFVIEHGDTAIYVTGDTVMYRGVREVAARFSHVRFVVAHLGAASYGPLRFTMNAAEGIDLARLFPAAQIIPVHYDGWTHFKQGRGDVEHAFASAGLDEKLLWLERGVARDL